MDISSQCPGENGLSHDIRIAAFGTCSACGGNHALPNLAMPAAVRPAAPALRPVRIPDAIEVGGPNTYAVTNATGDADHELCTMHLLAGPGWGF